MNVEYVSVDDWQIWLAELHIDSLRHFGVLIEQSVESDLHAPIRFRRKLTCALWARGSCIRRAAASRTEARHRRASGSNRTG
jgi:hypothetical protein